MKTKANITLVISILALAISSLLFFLNSKENKAATSLPVTQTDASGLKIAYIDADSIMVHYLLVEKLMSALESRGLELEKDLQQKQKLYEKDAAYFQEQVKKGSISEESANTIYEKLMQKQQELMNLRDKYAQEVGYLESQMNKQLLDNVSDYLERNNNFQYDYILNYSYTGDILLKNPKFNITDSVVEGLNKEYIQNNNEK